MDFSEVQFALLRFKEKQMDYFHRNGKKISSLIILIAKKANEIFRYLIANPLLRTHHWLHFFSLCLVSLLIQVLILLTNFEVAEITHDSGSWVAWSRLERRVRSSLQHHMVIPKICLKKLLFCKDFQEGNVRRRKTLFWIRHLEIAFTKNSLLVCAYLVTEIRVQAWPLYPYFASPLLWLRLLLDSVHLSYPGKGWRDKNKSLSSVCNHLGFQEEPTLGGKKIPTHRKATGHKNETAPRNRSNLL